jgi:inorganic triphosphatase YgiF
MRTEVEARFRAEGPAPLEALASAQRLGRADLGPARTVDETDRYLDTRDGRLAAARWACRLRSRDGVVRISLKGPPSVTDGAPWHHQRPELEGPATDEINPGAWPPSEALDLLDALREGAELAERLRLRQRRTERAVDVDGVPVGTLSLDEVRVVAGGSDLGELFVVELELDPAATSAERELAGLATALGQLPGLVPEGRTKLEHALERAAGR